MVGHGTTVALVAGGSRIGVAPRANLLLYKVGATYYQHKGTEDQPLPPEYRNGVRCQAFIHCLEDLIAQLDAGALPKGKTVVSISFCMLPYEFPAALYFIYFPYLKAANVNSTLPRHGEIHR